MNATFPSQPIRWLLLILFVLCCLSMLPAPMIAADSSSTQTTILTIQADSLNLKEIIGNRARMIQMTVVVVVFACSLLWWRR